MVMQLPKYKEGKGRAFSYISIVGKNYLILNNNNNYKKMIGYLIIEKSKSKLIINQKNIIYEDNIFLIQKII